MEAGAGRRSLPVPGGVLWRLARTVVVLALSLGLANGAERLARIRLTAYASPPGAEPGRVMEPGRVIVAAGDSLARVVAVRPVAASRTLLLVVDPNSYSSSEIRRRLTMLASVLAASTAPTWTVRIGIPILDGILSEPVGDARRLHAEIDHMIASYLPEHDAREPLSAGRTLDLVAGLIRSAEKQAGAVDCLLLFRDRRFADEGSEYLTAGVERLLSSTALVEGSTLYGWLDQEGILRAACAQSGGLTWSADTPAQRVLAQLAEERRRAMTLEVEVPYPERSSKIRLEVRASGDNGSGRLRAPESLWIDLDGGALPDHRRMEQGLTWVRRATEARAEGNFTLARRFAESAIQEDRWNPEGHCLAAIAASELGDSAAACAAAQEAMTVGGAEEHIQVVFASTCRKAGRAAEALGRLRQSDASGHSPAMRLELARLHAAVGDHSAARTLFEGLPDGARKDPGVLTDYAEVLARLGLEEQSRGQLQGVLALDPNYGRAMVLLARSYATSGNAEQALQWSTQAVERNPADPAAHAVLSEAQASRREWVRAADALRKAMMLAPERKDWAARYVDLLCRGGQERAAAAFLRTSLSSNPTDGDVYGSLGNILSRLGELEEAARVFETGGTLGDANGQEFYLRAAELRERRGEYGQALLDYRALLRKAPSPTSDQLHSQMRSHLSAISLLVDGHTGPAHPLAREFGLTPPSPVRQEKSEDSGMIAIPGGVALLSKTVGLGTASATDPDILARIFSWVLESGIQQSKQLRDNPTLSDALSGLRTHRALIEYLRKERMAPEDFDPRRAQELLFPLSGTAETLARTKRLLRFFGVSMNTRHTPGGGALVTLVLKEGGSMPGARQKVLRDMGVNLMDGHLREIRVMAAEDEVPIMLGSQVWATRILKPEGKNPRPLLERFFTDPRAMRLYLALAECSKATRAGLVQAYGPGALLEVVEPLAAYGRYLDFKDGKLVFPGVAQSWDALLGGSPGPAHANVSKLLRADDWCALRIYASLAQAPDSVRQHLTATPERLRQLYDMFVAVSRKGASARTEFGQPDLGRTLALMRADERGLLLPIDRRLAHAILPDAAVADPNAQAAFEPMRVPDRELARFLEWAHTLKSRLWLSPLEGLGLATWLQQTYPGMLDEEMAEAIVREPYETASMLDIVIDLAPTSDLVRRYLAAARELTAQGPRGWNTNRVRTFQSLFQLLALLRRQGALGHAEGLRLFDLALKAMEPTQEAAFACGVARFVYGDLLPAATAGSPGESADDLLFRALAGPAAGRELTYKGRLLRLDPALVQLKRMRAAILQQSYTPLSRLLEGFRILAESNRAIPVLDALTRAAEVIQAVDLSRVPSGKARLIARADTAKLADLLGAARGRRADADLQPLADEVAAALHVELGVTLLTFCYAFHGTPEADAMAFDPDFVRKHDFFAMSPVGRGPWTVARLEQKDGAIYCSGSLSGLGFELSRLETAQWAQNLGDTERESLVPSMLTGMRSVSRSRRTDRAQEYVALCVRVAREVLARSVLETDVRGWLEPYLNVRVLPHRREQILDALQASNPVLAARHLSPSELFLLGREWVEEMSTRGRPIFSPVLTRLVSVAPSAGADEALSFRRELDQYGVLLRRRMGINQPALAATESYEQLDGAGREELLYERICDLKIQLADLNYRAGIPAVVGEVEGELAIQEILPRRLSTRTATWKYALEQIGRLSPEQALGWVEELMARGTLAAARGGEPDEKGAGSSP